MLRVIKEQSTGCNDGVNKKAETSAACIRNGRSRRRGGGDAQRFETDKDGPMDDENRRNGCGIRKKQYLTIR